MPGFVCPTRFGRTHSRINPEKFVVIAHMLQTDRRLKVVDLGLGDSPEFGMAQEMVKKSHEIPGGGALTGTWESVGVGKAGFGHTHFGCFSIHFSHELSR